MHPRGVNGGSASKISLMEPMQASLKCGHEAVQKLARAFEIAEVNLEPRVDERPDQPGPHRSLMIGRIASAKVAVILRLVVLMIR